MNSCDVFLYSVARHVYVYFGIGYVYFLVSVGGPLMKVCTSPPSKKT